MHKKLAIILTLLIIYSNIFALVYAAERQNMPAFAVLESVSDKVDNKEEQKGKTVQTVKSVEAKPVAADANFNFKSKSQILMEMSTGTVIYENNANEKAYPASVTKIMTILLIMEAIDSGKISYTDMVTCSENAASMGGSQIWFKVGEQITVDEALKCICVVSANDVCIAMAEMIGSNEENFVKMMNDKAKALGMTGTNFVNPHGIDDPNHYTTARDIAIMSRELMINHPDVTKYTTIWMDSIRGGTFGLSNTNKLIRYYDGATGLKTGYTSTAMYNLSATATRNNMSLVAVVLTAPTSDIRNEEAKQLLNFGFTNYDVQNICLKGELVDSVKVNKYLNSKVDVVLKEGISLVKEKGSNIECAKKVEMKKGLQAPIKKGDVVGQIEYLNKEGERVGKSDIIVRQDIKKSEMLDYIKRAIRIFALNIEII